jgi:DNA recombination protein RmuC
MRVTVDEKLHSTLEKRLGESFKLVSEQLSTVNKSLGEMQSLADGVGDLKKVLTNVKTRGMMGEFQLHAILRDILTPEQYKENVVTKALSNERVEFAVRLPGIEKDKEILLPIDAKFPKEDYEKLIDSQQKQVLEEVEIHRKALRQRMKTEAKRIAEKYIDVPNTTDFALLFLPFEGLYAEVLNTPGLVDEMQREYRVVVAGPTTLAALLNSLQMGFRTLAIQKRSSEVWHLLSRIKTEFDRFGLILEKTKKRLDLAAGDLDLAYRRSEKIKRQLSATQTENNLLSEKTEEIT